MARRLTAVLLALSLGALTACDRGDGEAPGTTVPAPTTATASPGPAQTATAEPEETTTAEPTGEDDEPTAAPLPDGAITALVVGNDSREDDFAGLSDVIVLVQLSEDRDHLSLVSITRDSYVAIPGLGRDKINEAYHQGGVPLLRETVSDLMGGLEIDLVAQTNFEMFTDVAAALDGFWVDNRYASTVPVGSRELVFEEGRIRLDEDDALTYVRQRNTLPLGDLDRTERHRAALVGMMERLVQIREEEPERLADLLPVLHDNVRIVGDLHADQLETLVEVGAGLGPDDVTSLMVPVSYFSTTAAGAWINVLDADQTAALAKGLREGDLSDYVERYGTSYELTGS